MNRFPKHYHEGAEIPLCCTFCEIALTEAEADHYWEANRFGERDPVCFEA